MLYIESSRLRVEIARPHLPPATTTRFDRAGFITEVVLDGVHRFCATEPNNLSHPSSGGRGLCCEYAFDVSHEAEIGGLFPKPGVGLLRKTADTPYYFANDYQVMPCEIGFTQTPDSVSFVTAPQPCMGYALSQTRSVAVQGNTLTMDVELTNAGDKRFDAREYCHNFITINGMAIGPDYVVQSPQFPNFGDALLDGMLRGAGRGFTFAPYAPPASFMRIEDALLPLSGPLEWTMTNAAAKARIRAKEEIALCGVAIWAVDHMVSVESFHALSLDPGQTGRWQRSWTFESI